MAGDDTNAAAGLAIRDDAADGAGGGALDRNGDRAGAGGRVVEVIDGLRLETQAARALIEQMRDLVGDDEEMIATAIEGETDLHEAIASAFARLGELKALGSGIDNMVCALKARADRFERQQDLIREAIRLAMETAELKRIELPMGTISMKAVPPKAIVLDEPSIPSRFWKAQDPKLDRKAVLDALKANEVVPGAQLSNGSQTIQVTFS